jgi:hypothetical protein
MDPVRNKAPLGRLAKGAITLEIILGVGALGSGSGGPGAAPPGEIPQSTAHRHTTIGGQS